MQFEHPNSQPQLNDQTPLTDAVVDGASLVPFVLGRVLKPSAIAGGRMSSN